MTNLETKKVEAIRQSYTVKEKSDLETLKELDAKVKRPAKVFAYVYGSAASLVLGTGMCLAMKVIGNAMALGIVVGLLGIALTVTTYPLYKAILKARKNRYAKEIVALSNRILNEN